MLMVTAPSQKPFSYFRIAAIGSGFFGLVLVWTVYNAFMPLLLTRFIEQASVRGLIMSLDNLLAVLLIPVVGSWSDGLSGKLGKRLPFIAAGMPLAALLFAALPFSATSLVTLLIVDVFFLLAMTLYRAPVIALMPDHTPEEKRASANGVINLMGGVGAILATLLLGQLYDLGPSYPFVLSGVALLIAFWVLFASVDRHPPYVATAGGEDDARPLSSLASDLRLLTAPRYRQARLILAAIFCYFVGFSGFEAQFSSYAVGTLGVTGGAASVLLGLFSIAFVLGALPAGFVGDRFGKLPVMLTGLLILALLFLGLGGFGSLTVVRALLAVAGLTWALVNVQAYPLLADLGGETQIGFFTGLYYFFSMGAAILGPPVAGLGMDLFGGQSLFVLGGLSMLLGFSFLLIARRVPEQA